MRKSSGGKGVHEFREITPFYMQHSYSHFRYDPTYDSPKPNTSNKSDKSDKYTINYDRKRFLQEREITNRERKTSDQENKLSRAKESSLTKFDSRRRCSWTNEPSTFKKFSSNLLSDKHSTSLDDNIDRWVQRGVSLTEISFPTKSEVPETDDDNNSLPPIITPVKSSSLDGGSEKLDETKDSSVKTHSYQDPAKVQLLKELVQNRLGRGYTVADLAKEPFFEDVLDICDEDEYFPAYEVGGELTFENYRALRKCKYLRVSGTNMASLKEAALNYLNEDE